MLFCLCTQGGSIMRINTKCSVAVHCLLFLHEYGETQRVTSGILALSTGCNQVVIRNLISALKKAGISAQKPPPTAPATPITVKSTGAGRRSAQKRAK